MDIETLLGMRTGGNQAALAEALRSQARGGTVLGLSTIPQVAGMGEAQRRAAYDAATRGGALRQAEQTRAQQAQLQAERIAARQREGALDRAAQERARRLRTAAGGGAGRTRAYAPKFEEVNGVPVMIESDSAGGTRITALATGEEFSPEEFYRLSEDELEVRRRKKYEEAAGTKLAEEEAAIGETTTAYIEMEDVLGGALNQIGYGAETGPIASRFFSVRGPTKQFEQLQSRAALVMTGLTPRSLAPMSDRDIELVMRASLPEDLDERNLYYWLIHRRESLQRAREALEFKQDYIRKNKRRPSRKEMEAVSKRGGFRFETPPAEESGAMLHIIEDITGGLDEDTREAFLALPVSEQRQIFIEEGGPTYGREGVSGVQPPG